MSGSVLFDVPGPRARRRNAIIAAVGSAILLLLVVLVIRALAHNGEFTAAKWNPFLEWSTWRFYLLTGIWNTLWNLPIPDGVAKSVIVFVRLPRILCVALTGAALSLCGAAMQGLLRNPLADGSTLGVSSGASLGAILAIALGLTVPGIYR